MPLGNIDPVWKDRLQWDGETLDNIRFVGNLLISNGSYERALVFFKALVVLSNRSACDLQTLGAIYLQLGNNTLAIQLLEEALSIDHTHEYTRLNLAKGLFLIGYKDQATFHAEILKNSPNIDVSDQAQALLLTCS